MPKKTGTMKGFVVRDVYTPNVCRIYWGKQVTHKNAWINSKSMCVRIFEKHFFKLRPGAGPVPVEITIKRRGKR